MSHAQNDNLDFWQKYERRYFFGTSDEEILESSNERSVDEILIELHKLHGNKWKKMSSHFPGRNDSFIKNHFYSLLRKSLRKLNAYIRLNFDLSKVYKPLKLNFVFKLANLAEMERNDFSTKKNYQELLYDFLRLVERGEEKNSRTKDQGLDVDHDKILENFVRKILESIRQIEQLFVEFNLNRKGKSRIKCSKKLELKKEQIKKAQKRRMQEEEIRIFNIENLIPQDGSSTSPRWSILEHEAELMSFQSEESIPMKSFIMTDGESFDPILFK